MRLRYALGTIVPIALILSGCNNAKQNVDDYLRRAEAYQTAGDITNASKELQSALRLNPLNAQANAMLAKIEDDQGNLQEAVNHYILASRADAALLQPQLRLIELMIDANHLDEARAKANATLGSFPNSIEAKALRADIEQRQGDTAASETDTAAVLAKAPNNVRALAVAAVNRLSSKDLQGAMRIVDRGLSLHPGDVHLLEVKAAILLNENNPEKAIDTLNQIVKAEPRNVVAHSVLASAEVAAGHFDVALDRLKKAAAADPTNLAMQMALISFLAKQGTQADLVAQLQALIAENPKISTYDQTLAEFYRSTGKMVDAEKTLEKAVARLGDTPAGRTASVALAKAAILNSRFGLAKQRLNDVLAADPNNIDALLTSAILASQNGRFDEAINTLLSLVRISPVNAQAFQLLASDYMATGQQDLGINAMRRAAAVSPGDLNLQLRLAAMLQAANRPQEQNDVLTRLTLQAPNDPAPWLATGELAIQRKDYVVAERALSRLRGLPNGTAAAARLSGDLQAARGDATSVQSYKAAIQALPQPDTALLSAFIEAAKKAHAEADAAQFIETRAATQSTNTMNLWIAAISLWANAGAMDQARNAFEKAIQVAPQEIAPYEAYTSALLERNLFDQAEAVAGKAQGRVAEWSTRLLQGTIEERKGNFTAAMQFYKEAADLNPDSARAANNYASLLTDLSPKDTAALEAARNKLNGLEKSPDPLIVDTIAWLDFRLGRVDEARQLLTQIKAGASSNPQLRFHMAAALLASGEKTEGLALLETVKGLAFPGSDEVKSLSAT